MKYRELGNTGLKVSEIGFGAWGIGGDSYGYANDDESKRALLSAFDNGINFYDTSDAYGAGHSERLIGDTFKNVRDEIIIATKVGVITYSGRSMAQDFSANHIKNAIGNSLKRLKTDYVDVYQLHSPPIDILSNDESLRAFEDLKKQGKVKALGISVRAPLDGVIAIESGYFESVQVNFNVIDHRFIDEGLQELVSKKKIGIISRTPLCFGFLTGKISENTAFEPDDHRFHWSKGQLKMWSEAVRLFEPLYRRRGWTSTQLALKFCLAFDSVSTVIPGMMNCKHVEENSASSDLGSLSKDEISIINQIYKTHNFFESKKCNINHN